MHLLLIFPLTITMSSEFKKQAINCTISYCFTYQVRVNKPKHSIMWDERYIFPDSNKYSSKGLLCFLWCGLCVSLLKFRINICCLCGFSVMVRCQVHRLGLNPANLCSKTSAPVINGYPHATIFRTGFSLLFWIECKFFSLNSLWHADASMYNSYKWYLTLRKLLTLMQLLT